MALEAGTRLGPYEVTAPLGAGGMGEVYRARDAKLGREVAIKVLPEEFTQHREKLARFEREAKLLAALNHVNVATLFGLEEAEGKPFLVMELIEGETLAERIARGPIPVDEALTLSQQIAEALEAAHEKGVIHRDLKPANIKVDPEGQVKVLDFGLAKAFAEETPESDASFSPTLSREATQAGVILGTAAYMSPEQAKGKAVDKRTDIFSFGIVLFEMLTGKKAFGGEDVSEILAAIIRAEPDWPALPRGLDPRIRLLLKRCLRKARPERLQAIGDARLEIAEARSGAVEPHLPAADRSEARWRLLAGVAVFVALVAVGVAINGSRASSTETRPRLGITLPEGQELTGIADTLASPISLSPDGRIVVYSVDEGGQTRLYRRDLDRFDPEPINGTEGATAPFFSPDGDWLGFFAGGRFQRMPVDGGAPIAIVSVPTYWGTGIDWGEDGWIRYPAVSVGSGLWQVPAEGGTPEPITTVDSAGGEYGHAYPQLLPGGRQLLFAIWGDAAAMGLAILDLDTGERHTILPGASAGVLLPTGHLVYKPRDARDQLHAVAVDRASFAPAGPAAPVVVGADFTRGSGNINWDVSRNGSLAYLPDSGAGNSLAWVDRRGSVREIQDPAVGRRDNPRLSPDGKQLAYVLQGGDIWILDPATGRRTRHAIRDATGSINYPIWTVDGSRVVFGSNRDGAWNVYGKAVGSDEEAQRLVESPISHFLGAWSPDGNALLVDARSPATGLDIYRLVDDDLVPLLVTEFDERDARVSPDGHSMAYVSNESGRKEVYTTDFPAPGRRRLVSTDGGTEPLWSPDGRELFYRVGKQVMAVDVSADGTLGAPRPTGRASSWWRRGPDAVPRSASSRTGSRS